MARRSCIAAAYGSNERPAGSRTPQGATSRLLCCHERPLLAASRSCRCASQAASSGALGKWFQYRIRIGDQLIGPGLVCFSGARLLFSGTVIPASAGGAVEQTLSTRQLR